MEIKRAQKSVVNTINIPTEFKGLDESFQNLRTNILYSSDMKAIIICSCLPDEGKTTVALNAAVSFSQLGKKVLLIDGDMRRHSLTQLLKVSRKENGLSEYLTNQTTAFIHPTDIENLFFLSSGAIPPNSTELLAGDLFKNLIEHARKEFDYIFIDSPPFSACNDAVTCAQVTDGTIITVRYQYTSKRILSKLVETYQRNGAKIVGFV